MNTQYVEQVGGDHYGNNTYGHWDMVDQCQIPYLEGNATKYLYRWHKKNGIQDLKKAISYIDKRMASNYSETHDPLYVQQQGYEGLHMTFYQANDVKPWERAVIDMILKWKDYSDLNYAKNLILAQIKHEETKQGIKNEQ